MDLLLRAICRSGVIQQSDWLLLEQQLGWARCVEHCRVVIFTLCSTSEAAYHVPHVFFAFATCFCAETLQKPRSTCATLLPRGKLLLAFWQVMLDNLWKLHWLTGILLQLRLL